MVTISRQLGQRGKIYMTCVLYAKFSREKAVPEIRKVIGNLDNVMFQDDQDGKQRTQVVMETISELFQERILHCYGDAKLADCWCIENLLGMRKERTRSKTFANEEALIRCANKECVTVTKEQCQHMMYKATQRFGMVIKNNGDQVYEH